jgi:RNA polymerase sigma-70 factor (ECF subfamily)
MIENSSFKNLMARLRAGDDDAARQVFQRFAQRLIALAQSRLHRGLRHKADPEDVVQSVYRSFFTRHAGGQFDIGNWDGLWAMLTVITVRKCANQVEKVTAACRDVRREQPALGTGDESGKGWEALSREPTPEEAALLADTVEDLMQGMDEREREILALSLQGYSAAEISERIGRAERTVRRVREHIRSRLQRMREAALEKG